jgi:D-tyrosyl-tRNA(Tyr) deacylase
VRAVVQRVRQARVMVGTDVVGAIDEGLCVLLGVASTDTESDADRLCQKITALRIFNDDQGHMNRAVDEIGGALLIVSQFTLHADTRKGRRPSFQDAAPAERAKALYEHFVTQARRGPVPVATGEFQAHMHLALVNDGPVTIVLDTREWSAA